MATRPKGYGLSAEAARKIKEKYDPEGELQTRQWMEDVLGEPIEQGLDPNTPLGPTEFSAKLKDGVYLCRLLNILLEDKGMEQVKFKQSKLPFVQMVNIEQFLKGLERYGLLKSDIFQVVDLYEGQNPWNVVCTVFALGRKAQTNGFSGPVLGPREAERNVREFTEEQLRASESMVPLQAGTNKLASQKGIAFGKGRFITDIKVDKASKDGEAVIGLQAGTNQVASQAGMSFGNRRQIADDKQQHE